MSYSQNAEEEAILRATHHISPDQGYVLDIGANDGMTFSNSRALIENGWGGCLVEPDYEAFGKLLELYGKNDRIRLINAAVGTEGGLADFRKSSDCGLYSSVQKTGFEDKILYCYRIPKVTTSQLVDQMPRGPNVISVDIEGQSFEVLASLPIDSWNVQAMCVEHDGRAVEISGWGRSKKYRVAELNAENLVLVRP